MEKIKGPKTLDDFNEMKKTLLFVMSSIYCDHLMFVSAQERLNEVEKKIEELEQIG